MVWGTGWGSAWEDEPSDEELAELEAQMDAETTPRLTALECARLLALVPRVEAEVREHNDERQVKFLAALNRLERRVDFDLERYDG
jgi:hypothetical protein